MARQHWLIKSEPNTYGYQKLEKDGRTVWDGIRSFEARNNLRAMKEGDLLLFYHSNIGKEVVGIARVVREAYPDPSAKDEDWSVVEIAAVAPFKKAVGLDVIKSEKDLASMVLVKKSRLSVMPVSSEHFQRILELGETKIPRG
jgi:predicted RNA-binding protein with PUA-like domain